MANIISKLLLTDESSVAADVRALIVGSDNSMACNKIADYLMAFASKCRRGSFTLQVQNGDGVAASGTVTAASASAVRATGTVTCASVQAGDTATINGVVFTAVSGTPAAHQFDISGDDTAAAASLVLKFTAATDAALSGMSALNALGVVTFTDGNGGSTGNSKTLATSNNTRLAKSGTTLSGGSNDTVTVNGIVFYAVYTRNTSDPLYPGNGFAVGGLSNTAVATNLAAAIAASVTAGISGIVTASSLNAVCTISCLVKGLVGNAISLTSSSTGTRLVTSGTKLAGGLEDTATTYSYSCGI